MPSDVGLLLLSSQADVPEIVDVQTPRLIVGSAAFDRLYLYDENFNITNKPTTSLTAMLSSVYSLTVSNDNSKIACTYGDYVSVYDANTYARYMLKTMPAESIPVVAFSHDSAYIYVGLSVSPWLRKYDATTGVEIAITPNLTQKVMFIHASLDGTKLAIGHTGYALSLHVVVYNLSNFSKITGIPQFVSTGNSTCQGLKFSPDGSKLVVAFSNGSAAWIYNTTNWTYSTTIYQVTTFDISSDNAYLVIAINTMVIVMNLNTLDTITNINANQNVGIVKFNPSVSQLLFSYCSSSTKGVIKAYNTSNWQDSGLVFKKYDNINNAAIRLGDYYASGQKFLFSMSGQAPVFSVMDMQTREVLTIPDYVLSVTPGWSAYGKTAKLLAYVSTATYIPNMTFYDVSADKFTRLENPTVIAAGYINSCAFSTEDEYFAIGCSQSPYYRIYQVTGLPSTWPSINPLNIAPTAAVKCCTFSNSKKFFAIGQGSSPLLRVYDTRQATWTQITLSTTMPGVVTALKFNSDDSKLYVGSSTSPFLFVYETTTWTLLSIPAASSYVTGIDISPDGRWLGVSMYNAPYLLGYDLLTTPPTKYSPTYLSSDYNGYGCKFLSNTRLALARDSVSLAYFTIYDVPSWTKVSLTGYTIPNWRTHCIEILGDYNWQGP